MKFAPYYPQKPHTITKAWGVYDPASYHQFGFDYHNGDDNVIPVDKLIHEPFKGTAVRLFDQPTGGGIGCGILSDDVFDWDAWDDVGSNGTAFHFPAGQARVLVDFLHCEKNCVIEQQKLNTGDIVAIPDNTGFTTGPHTHRQWRRVNLVPITPGVAVSPAYRVLGENYIQDFDQNDANNSFNPDKFWNGKYAQDIPVATTLTASAKVITDHIRTSPIPNPEKVPLLVEMEKILDYISSLI